MPLKFILNFSLNLILFLSIFRYERVYKENKFYETRALFPNKNFERVYRQTRSVIRDHSCEFAKLM